MVSHVHHNLNANENFVLSLLQSSLHASLMFIYMFSLSLRKEIPIKFALLPKASEDSY